MTTTATSTASTEIKNKLYDILKQYPSSDPILDEVFVKMYGDNYELLSYLGILEAHNYKEHNKYLNDESFEHLLKTNRHTMENLKLIDELHENENENFNKNKYQNQYLRWVLKNDIEGHEFNLHSYILNPLFGILESLTQLFTSFHRLEDENDYHNYIARLKCIPTKINQIIEFINLQHENNIFYPKNAVESEIEMIDDLIIADYNHHTFYQPIKNKNNNYLKNDIIDDLFEDIFDDINDSFRKLSEYLKSTILPSAHNNGVWYLPNGKNYYKYMLKKNITCDMTPEEVHMIGLNEVEKIEKQIRCLMSELTKSELESESESLGSLLRKLNDDPTQFYPNTETGRQECVADFEKIMNRCRTELWPLFDKLPKSKVEMKVTPKHEETSGIAAYYYPPSIDRKRSGAFYVNLRDMREIQKFGMETLTVHEAEPGHHFQFSLQNESDILHILQKVIDNNAFAEGWALYCEKLAYEQNFYKTPLSKIGHLHDEMLRALRLVIDTGIHYMMWTRDYAIDYMSKYLGYEKSVIVTEVDRYFCSPGQACGYKIGQLKISDLRDRLQFMMSGPNFSYKTFHNLILDNGSPSLDILENIVDDYIDDYVAEYIVGK